MLDVSWILTFLVALVTWFLTSKWLKIRSLPPGPLPLPILGNLLRFRSADMSDVAYELRRQYGGIFTVWFGSIPFVIVADYNMIKEGLIDRKSEIAGRIQVPVFDKIFGTSMSLTSSDHSRSWETLRKMGQAAIRKYALSEHLPPLVDELTEDLVQKMMKQKTPFFPRDFTHLLFFNVISSTMVGQRYKDDDPMFLNFHHALDEFEKFMSKGLMAFLIPISKPFFRQSENEMLAFQEKLMDFLSTKMKEHMETYQSNDIRDMMDSLIYAREEILAEMGLENAPHLNDRNVLNVIMDLFQASIDTSNFTVSWLIIYVTMHPEIQDKMIQEIRDNIGDRIPTQKDRKSCPYTMAVLIETTRIQAVAPFGLPHKTMQDSKLGSYVIPKGTGVLFHYGAVHHDSNYWKDPEKFSPERFLDSDGKLSDARFSKYMPFGQGRRSCAGERLAIEDMFLVVVGIFKRCRLTLKDPPVDLKSATTFFQMPKKYTVMATPIAS